ncbi:nitrogen fixation protein NifY [Brenneria roseae subsp. americana]|uniref:Nitrogen fixation protein NifY n=1 Tax=Brenneria roseae subsp. americana TaxID=1508507 RepID=A0A2U1TTR6_9GAMM|nr:nitrogen fixation protein NifY [Brenneria roseae subsp. americana]
MSLTRDDLLFWRLFALAQLLPEITPATLIKWLETTCNEALTLERLSSLSLDELSRHAPLGHAALSVARWQQIMDCLNGNLPPHLTEQSERCHGQQLRVAFASSNGLTVNGHFGQCRLFFIYAWDRQGPFLSTLRRYQPKEEEDGNEGRLQLLTDCHLLFCESIGGPAAAKVIRRNIHPIKVPVDTTIDEQLQALQNMIAEHMPPWLAKRLGKDNPLRQRQFGL